MGSSDTGSLSDGEVTVRLEQEAIHIKAIDRFGDPVELTKAEALKLSDILRQFADKIIN